MDVETLALKKDQVLCREGEIATDLYIVLQGELLVCVRKASQVTAIARIGADEFIGELSFFDGLPRGADIVALTDCQLVKIPVDQITTHFPAWVRTLGQVLSQKLRTLDDVIRQRGIKKGNLESLKPLSIEEQRHYYQLLGQQRTGQGP